MPFQKENPESFVPIFVSYCIDYRYDALSSEYLRAIGYDNSYYLATNAGAALPLGYKKSCKKSCRSDDKGKCSCSRSKKKCCPGTDAKDVLRESFNTNLAIALTLQPITVVYLLNHQDCGAIRAFLPCSGYPASGEENKKKEICINASILTFAQDDVKKQFNKMEVFMGLIDSNGSVADYDIKTKKWTVIYVGSGENTDGLWFGRDKGDKIRYDCNKC